MRKTIGAGSMLFIIILGWRRVLKAKRQSQAIEMENKLLKQKVASNARSIAAFSHDLNTPLTSIRGYTKGMLDGVFPSGEKKYIQLIYDKTLVMERMIDELHEQHRFAKK